MTKANTAVICLSPYAGGMELDAIKLAEKLSKYTAVTLIAKEDHFIAKEHKKRTTNLKLETIKFKSNLGPSIIKNARQIIKKHNIKNVIFFGASELKSLYFSFLGLEINLIVRHGTTKSRPKKDWFHKLIYSNVNYHVSICEHLYNNVAYIIPFGKHTKAKLIYSSFTFDKPQINDQERPTLLHIGRITHGKGQIDAIKACAILVDEDIDFRLNLVGAIEESYKEEFMTFYHKCSYKDKINLIGFTNDVKTYIQQSNIFIFPSYGEGLSNAFLEALSNNLVCLSYDNTSFPELQKLGFHFKMAKNKNINDLKEKLIGIIHNLITEKENSKTNYKLANEIFTLDNEMNGYLELLQ